MDYLEFWTMCSGNGIVMDKEQIDTIKRYVNELVYWNDKVNMISRKDVEHILERHILHSLTIAKYVSFPPKSRCLDVGTGGGLPGIPLKICFPEINMLLVDSILKKIKITDMLAKHTGLRKIDTICTRAEDLALDPQYVKSFDFVVSRAVSKITSVVGWVLPLIKPGAQIILLKGGDLTVEKEEALELFPNMEIKEIPIKMFGFDWFTKEEKKLIICTFKPVKKYS